MCTPFWWKEHVMGKSGVSHCFISETTQKILTKSGVLGVDAGICCQNL
jgi:hypothetical protein